MALIAKRKVRATWRQAVAERAAERGVEDACLARFDALAEAGRPEIEAAYRALQDFDLLWRQPMPGDPHLPPANDPQDLPAA